MTVRACCVELKISSIRTLRKVVSMRLRLLLGDNGDGNEGLKERKSCEGMQ